MRWISLILILVTGTGLLISASVNRLEYYFDTDPGWGNGIAFNIIPGVSVGAIAEIALSSPDLSEGLHILYVRAQDVDGKWSLTQSKTVCKMLINYPGNLNITWVEYYIDTDPGRGSGTATSFTPSPNVNLSALIDLTGLSRGYHSLYFRCLRSDGIWSMDTVKNIYYLREPGPQDLNIVRTEYYFDTDPGKGNGVLMPATTGNNIIYIGIIDMTGLSTGPHSLYIRCKSEDGQWSLDQSHTVFKTPAIISHTIAGFKWNFEGQGVNPETIYSYNVQYPAENIVTTIALNLGNLELNSLYKMYFWAEDDNGKASHKYLYIFRILPSPEITSVTKENNLLRIEWLPVENATSYKVHSSTNPEEGFELNTDGVFAGTVWTIPLNKIIEFYQVSAVDE